jgi:signal peptidase II
MTADSQKPGDENNRPRARVTPWITFWALLTGAVALDWWSKTEAMEFHVRANGLLAESMPAPIFELGFFNLQVVREYNMGMAFGLLQDTANSHVYIGAIRALAVVVLLFLFHRPVRRTLAHQLALGALIAGTAGNLLDNVFHMEMGHEHSVRDFILVSISNRSLPAFNLADVYVAIGAVMFFGILARTRVKKD